MRRLDSILFVSPDGQVAVVVPGEAPRLCPSTLTLKTRRNLAARLGAGAYRVFVEFAEKAFCRVSDVKVVRKVDPTREAARLSREEPHAAGEVIAQARRLRIGEYTEQDEKADRAVRTKATRDATKALFAAVRKDRALTNEVVSMVKTIRLSFGANDFLTRRAVKVVLEQAEIKIARKVGSADPLYKGTKGGNPLSAAKRLLALACELGMLGMSMAENDKFLRLAGARNVHVKV